ncbi:MAG: hypothetical protein KKF20_07330 [Bacteroidetes bacterium]|nr:hypothetical protein [Bacteroidota bacterium]MBU2472206.1 hypothetical protein [Bacteroidota bacterium]
MADSNTLKILLVDDEEPFRKVLGDFLNSTNLYVTYLCESGEEAVEYKMPGISDLNVLQMLVDIDQEVNRWNLL